MQRQMCPKCQEVRRSSPVATSALPWQFLHLGLDVALGPSPRRRRRSGGRWVPALHHAAARARRARLSGRIHSCWPGWCTKKV